jgi:hypothetical protein
MVGFFRAGVVESAGDDAPDDTGVGLFERWKEGAYEITCTDIIPILER